MRDVMLPGELRKAFSEVLKAKQEARLRSRRSASCKRSKRPTQARRS